MTEPTFIPLATPPHIGDAERLERARDFADAMATRRTVRDYAPPPIQMVARQSRRNNSSAPRARGDRKSVV